MPVTINIPGYHVIGDTIKVHKFSISKKTGSSDPVPIDLTDASVNIAIREKTRNGKKIVEWNEKDGIIADAKNGIVQFKEDTVVSGAVGNHFYAIKAVTEQDGTQTYIEGGITFAFNMNDS